MKNNSCSNCDSTSMEMCLLIRHCKNWAVRNTGKEDKEVLKKEEEAGVNGKQ